MLVAGGSTNVSTYFAMRLAADGTAATGLTETAFDLQYVRSGAAPSTKVDATAGTAGGAAAHVDNTVVEPDATDQPGLYRVDWPDAAFAAGVREVILTVKVATAFTEHLRVEIDQTLLPTVAGRTLDVTATGAAGIDWGNVENPTTAVDLSGTDIQLVDTTTTNTDMLTAAAVNAEVDTALADIHLDHLMAAAAADVVADGSVIAHIVSATEDWSTFVPSTDSLEAIRDRGDAAWTTGAGGTPPDLLQSTTIATLASQTSFTLTAGSADDDAYNGALAVITDVSTSTQKAVGEVLDYTGSTKTVTLKADPGVFTMAATDNIDIVAAPNQLDTLVAGVTLADGVEHGGTSATLRLGASGATPAFYVTNSSGIAARIDSSAGSSAGMRIQGGGAAAGIRIDGGTTGVGVQLIGGATSGDAVTLTATSGVSVNAPDGITADITGNLSGSVGSLTGHTVQTGDTYPLANGSAGFVAIDTVVDAIKVKTDDMTYTKANELDVNTQSINGAAVVGDGNATPWDGA